MIRMAKQARRVLVSILLGGFLLLGSGPETLAAGPPPVPEGAKAERAQFIIRLKPAHPEAKATPDQQAVIERHFEYLQSLLADGKLILAGLALDDYAGIVVIEAADALEAEKLMVSDPAVRTGTFLAELHPFRVSLLRSGR